MSILSSLFKSNQDEKLNIENSIKKIESSTSLSMEKKRSLISTMCINPNISLNSPLIDRYPLDLISSYGNTQQKIMTNLINYFKRTSGLQNIYGGYVLLKEPIHSFLTIGMTSLVGMNIDSITNNLKSEKNIALCYIAIPIDDADYLIENSSILDWEFQEKIVDSYLGCSTIPIGSLKIKNIPGRLRTLKWTWDIDS